MEKEYLQQLYNNGQDQIRLDKMRSAINEDLPYNSPLGVERKFTAWLADRVYKEAGKKVKYDSTIGIDEIRGTRLEYSYCGCCWGDGDYYVITQQDLDDYFKYLEEQNE